MTFVVVGGGPTGVEMAGQLCELSHRALRPITVASIRSRLA